MDMSYRLVILSALGVGGSLALSAKLRQRLLLSKAKHRSLTGHPRIARRIAGLIPFYEYDETQFFRCDEPPAEIAARRTASFWRLSKLYHQRFSETNRLTTEVEATISDLQFTKAYRVPFQFRGLVSRHLPVGAFLKASDGVMLTDLDGNRYYDLTGSYGVNLLGYDFYKSCIRKAEETAGALGPVLGAYHPVVAYNVARLKAISGLDECSFHMSGTEAVMQAVRLARYHTGRSQLVRFSGAYHGWWGDVQPGIGNPAPAPQTYTLKDMSQDSLRVLEVRRDIACVLVNPLQALHPNAGAPSDGSLTDSSRAARFDKEAYAAWLKRLREVCTARNIVLIFDEVFVGFRVAMGGAQEYFGVRADMVTYGKTLGGGLPVGVLCGRKDLMKRYRDDRPADICFARGTFNAHPYVMGAMAAFLRALEQPEIAALYGDLDGLWNARAAAMNHALREADVPVEVQNLSSIWSVLYTKPSRYNWMFQYYLRAEGLALSWIGTGRLIFSLNYSEADFEAVVTAFTAAAKAMKEDGWWFESAASDRAIRRQILKEIISHRLKRIRGLMRARARAG
ncbi:MAG TPA: aminotransferase class III-fold pyridoxal phosphate-dependent enzyme [Methylocella sp.]|nr:aminotransferase class III-fold pyridoxal phosphate-dependent enzyme [Methylocella sp.]